ncbi:hypothetical protein GCM10028804_57440 [Larkinella terrae]
MPGGSGGPTKRADFDRVTIVVLANGLSLVGDGFMRTAVVADTGISADGYWLVYQTAKAE